MAFAGSPTVAPGETELQWDPNQQAYVDQYGRRQFSGGQGLPSSMRQGAHDAEGGTQQVFYTPPAQVQQPQVSAPQAPAAEPKPAPSPSMSMPDLG